MSRFTRTNLVSGLGWPPISINSAHEEPRLVLWKTLNRQWGWCSPLVSKWAGILLKVERTNQSGSNESMNLKQAQKLYMECVGKV